MSIDKVLRLLIDELQVWTRDKKFQIMLDLFHKCVLSLRAWECWSAWCSRSYCCFLYGIANPYCCLLYGVADLHLALLGMANSDSTVGNLSECLDSLTGCHACHRVQT